MTAHSAKPVVVCDAQPFICLEQEPHHFSYFMALFQKVLVPGAVAQELVQRTPHLSPVQYFVSHGLESLVEIIEPVTPNPLVASVQPPFHAGELEAISLAAARSLPLVIEEKRGRNFANRHGVAAGNMGTFVVRACRNGEMERQEAETMLRTMERVHMFDATRLHQFLEVLTV